MVNNKHKHKDVVIKKVNGELVVTSRQVAEDFEKEHNDVKKRIRELIKDMGEISHNYFINSEYKDTMNRLQNEYLLTKEGFSLLVMGFTGAKALQWKIKYIEAFKQMEKQLKEIKMLSPMELMELQFKVIKEQEEKIVQVENKVDKLKDDMPLFQVDCKELQGLVRKKGLETLGGKGSQAYKDNSLRCKVYIDIQQQLKREFQVTRYEAIKRSQFDKAKEIIADYKVPFMLEDEIIKLNNQIAFSKLI